MTGPFEPPTPDCETCRWWREGWMRAWCSLGTHCESRGTCEDFEPGGTDWAGMVGGNGDVRDR